MDTARSIIARAKHLIVLQRMAHRLKQFVYPGRTREELGENGYLKAGKIGYLKAV